MLKERISGNYNAISIDRFSPKTKIRKYLWYFNDSLSCDPDFLLSRKDLFSSLENERASTPQQVIGANAQNLAWKRMLEYYLKIPPQKRISEISSQKLNQ